MNAPKNLRIAKAKQKLAAGILAQARRDLRKFRDRATAVERELYRDAYTWVTADNCRWPFSSTQCPPDETINPSFVNAGSDSRANL